MSTNNKDEFLAALRKSDVLSADILQTWIANNPTDDAQKTAIELVRAGLITRWQAKYLMSGRHLLKIGSYVLLERLAQDDLGDLFIANHTSLNRKVQIQFLPAELKPDSEECKRFLQRVGIASELDHPNLVHIYDVDQEKGRYYLITEFYAGTSLDTMTDQINSERLAKVLLQTVKALEHVHENKIVHGSVSQSNIVICNDDQIKLKGLALSTLRNQETNKETTDRDWTDLGNLASLVFSQLPMTEQTGRLESIIANIGSEFSSTEEVSQSLTGYLNHIAQTAPANEILEALPLEGDMALTETTSAPYTSNTNPKTGKQTDQPATSKLPWILGAAIVAGLAILGATIFIVLNLSSTNKVAKSPPPQPGTSSRAARARQQANPFLAGKLEIDPNLSMEEQIDAIAKEEPATTPDPVVTPAPATEPPATEPPATEPPATEPPATEPPATKPPATKPPATKPPATKPPATFVGLPAHFDLPINTQQEVFPIGKIQPVKGYSLGLELISGPEISRSKIYFELKPNHAEKIRQWDVLYKKRENEAGTAVAKFVNQGNDFNFQWYPSAADDKNVNYLRNCVIKFNLGPKNRETRTLRKPIFIGGFKFADDNPEVKRDLEIAWLPDPKAITTQLGELKPQQFGKTYYENDMISKKSPVRIAFSDIDYEQMSWVLVTADVKAKTKLSASLQLGLDPRQRPKLAKPKLLDDALNWLNQNAAQAKRQSDQIKGISIDALRKQTNNQSLTFPQKQKMEANFKQRSDIAQEQTKKFDEQRKNSIDKFYGKVIPITISYKLGNQQITLATTKPEK